MPRLPIDYSKTVIYKIVCNDLSITECYVGHSTDFTRRKQEHKGNTKNEKRTHYMLKVYATIRENGGWENYSMIEIEKYPCMDSHEASARERYYYENLNSGLNTIHPQRSKKEYMDKYCEENRDRLLIEKKKWRSMNLDVVNKRKREIMECVCGCSISRGALSRHIKKPKHISEMLLRNLPPIIDDV